MKRVVLIFTIFLVLNLCLYSANESLNIGFSIPDDYGVIFPEEALRLDRFVFEIETPFNTHQLVQDNNIDLGYLSQWNEKGLLILLRYYGNLSYEYSVRLSVGRPVVWNGPEGGNVPVDVDIKSATTDPAVWVAESDEFVDISVVPSGLMLGVPVAEISLDWDFGSNPIPGDYSTTLFVVLSAE